MRNIVLFLIMTLTWLLAGCVSIAPQTHVSPVPTQISTSTASTLPTEPAPTISTTQPQVTADPTKATLLGKVRPIEGGELKALSGTVVWLAQIHWNADKTDGAFVLNGAESPNATIKDDSSFAFAAVPPGDYVIVVGDPMGVNAVVLAPDGKAKVVTLEAGRTLDVGNLEVELTSQGD